MLAHLKNRWLVIFRNNGGTLKLFGKYNIGKLGKYLSPPSRLSVGSNAWIFSTSKVLIDGNWSLTGEVGHRKIRITHISPTYLLTHITHVTHIYITHLPTYSLTDRFVPWHGHITYHIAHITYHYQKQLFSKKNIILQIRIGMYFLMPQFTDGQ